VRSWVLLMALTGVACSTDAPGGAADAAIVASPDAAAIVRDDAAAPDAAPVNDDAAAPDAAPVNDDAAAPVNDDAASSDAAAPVNDDAAVVAGPMELTSPTLSPGGVIPRESACQRRGSTLFDIQPELAFTNVPVGTQSLAIVLIDDSIDFVHWIALDLPAGTTGLARNASGDRMLPAGTREIPAYGTQYRGPCPDQTHTYTFRLYALPVAMTTYRWARSIDAADLAAAFANPLAVATLTGTYTP